eukprot:3048170-Prymnesium_polylepis.1
MCTPNSTPRGCGGKAFRSSAQTRGRAGPCHWDGGSLELRAVSIVLVTHGWVMDPSHLSRDA